MDMIPLRGFLAVVHLPHILHPELARALQGGAGCMLILVSRTLLH